MPEGSPVSEDRRNSERLEAAHSAAVDALYELFRAKLAQMGHHHSERVYINARFNSLQRVVDRLLRVTILDKLDLTGF